MIHGKIGETLKRKIRAAVLTWYRRHERDLPWRYETDPYRVLVSEIMLQQTQVSRVLVMYPRFLKRFPTLAHLARARTSSVIRAWKGMGYNNRALRLQQLARQVMKESGGTLPRSVDALRLLPGIGRYTAGAVASFAFGVQVPVVDTNISRILRRLFPPGSKATARHAGDEWAIAEELLPRGNAGRWNEALMDLGATVCSALSPRCGQCPLQELCPSAHKVSRKKARTAKAEPGRGGIPNRIYRGRIVEALRSLKHGESIASAALARKAMHDFHDGDRKWFGALLDSLERDGLVRRHKRSRVSLPA
jgi:A/G-specific adenine glycosylase